MGKLSDCERIVQEALDGLGGLDVIITNAVGPSIRFYQELRLGRTSAISWLYLMYEGLDKILEIWRP